jgi:hypothetical protein
MQLRAALLARRRARRMHTTHLLGGGRALLLRQARFDSQGVLVRGLQLVCDVICGVGGLSSLDRLAGCCNLVERNHQGGGGRLLNKVVHRDGCGVHCLPWLVELAARLCHP